jgi:prepilin-type N-terminal cleavage/methylation domain-containing protein
MVLTRQGRKKQQAFTLIELMITVAILGILAALAIPTFTAYVARSKSAEVSSNLNQLFKSAASYYTSDIGGKGINASITGNCTVEDDGPEPATPSGRKQQFVSRGHRSFEALHIKIGDFVYFSYGLRGAGEVCGHSASQPLYTFYANGDLDEDGTMSTFELIAGSDEANLFYHARGLYTFNETE